MVDMSTVGRIEMPQRSPFETPRRALSEDGRIVRYWHRLGCQAIEVGKQPEGGMNIYSTVVCKHHRFCRKHSSQVPGTRQRNKVGKQVPIVLYRIKNSHAAAAAAAASFYFYFNIFLSSGGWVLLLLLLLL